MLDLYWILEDYRMVNGTLVLPSTLKLVLTPKASLS